VATYWRSYNEMRIALRRLPAWQAAAALARRLLVGERRSPGLLLWLLAPLGPRVGVRGRDARPAISGRLAALRNFLGEKGQRARARDRGRDQLG
jgi:hypothetical protein